MNKIKGIIIILLIGLVVLTVGCRNKNVTQDQKPTQAQIPTTSSGQMHTGQVIETMDAGGYMAEAPAQKTMNLPEGHPDIKPQTVEASIKSGDIQKAKGGYTVEECFTKKESLKNKKIHVRGKVVKVNSGIMGRNWVHIQDGTGQSGTNDLTVTSNQTAKVGDVVLVNGMLAADKDFGGGYKYAAIIENGVFATESN